ncbi:uncharacterized protein LOC133172983 [Saccostrea echinata]|uniref:uncharacterized protein LOC133172983 n=1 Tax=Saccostrea echinata TaxID=191078 RepID=UPI002A83C34B|nr:uncharacterized protein LOC133172983 [Saccostrea echinata]
MAQGSFSENERPVESLQKCVLFLRDNIHREKLLIDHLLAESELSDEEKQGLKEGKDYICIGKELKSFLRNGPEKCKELLNVFKQTPLFKEFKEQEKKETVEAEKENLTLNSIREHREVLLEELEPSLINDILLENSVIRIEEHDEAERDVNRKEKCRVVLSLPEKHPDVLEKFKYAMQRSKCLQALDMMKGIHTKKPGKRHNFLVDPEYLHSNYEFLVDEIEPGPLSNILIEQKILDMNELERIKSKPSRKQQAKGILHWLTDSFGRHDQSESVLNKFGHCLEELGWEAVMRKLKGKDSPVEDFIECHNTGKEEEGFIILKPEETGQQPVYEGKLPSKLVFTLSIPEKVDQSKVAEAIKFLNRDTELCTRLSQLTHMKIDKAEGSLVLHLTSLTEEAGQRFLADGGRLVKEVATTVLDLVDFSEKLYDDKKPLDIQVTVSAAVSDSSKREDISNIHRKIQLKIQENWDLLIDELEPCLMLSCLKKNGLMTEKDESCILESNERRARVVAFLQTLLKTSNVGMLDYFVQILKKLDKSDLAEKLESGDVDIAHQEAEMVRKCLLLHFNEALEEIDSCMIQDTLTKCGDPVPDNIRPKSGFSRRGRAYNFLIYVFGSDGLVLVLKKVVEHRGMGHFFNIFHADIEESTKGKNTSTSKEELKENVFFDCKYTSSLKEGYKPSYGYMGPDVTWEIKNQLMFEFTREGMTIRTHHRVPHRVVNEHRRIMECPPQRCYRRYKKDRSIPVTFPSEGKRTWQVVAAIDFGTAYSGFAFSMRDNQFDVVAGKWKTHSSDLLESPKTPTSLLLTSNNEFVAFGYEAEKQFRELVEEDKHRDFRFFNHFKMVLFRGKILDTTVEVLDHMNRPMKALDVLSLAIKNLYDQCSETLREKSIKKEDIRWVVTVPAIWDEFAKQFMRNAAEKAGIPRNQLTLVLEPEAAAIYIIKGSRTDLTSKSINKYSRGTQILLVDLGGGTADFSLIGISGDRKLEVLHKASGGALGGNTINTKVWEILENLLGKNVIDEFKKQTSDCMEMESNIELKKRDLSSESKLQLTMFPSLSETCKNLTGKTYKDLVGESQYANLVKVRTGKIIFEHELIDQMFELTLAESFYIMDKLLKNGSNVQDIVLVGGFSDSEIIQKQFKERFSDYEVIIPADAGLAVLKGAVIFGHNENLIKSRICPFTYGIEVLRFWLASDPESSKKIINGTSYCTGIFDELVTIGDTVEVGKTVEREFFAPSNIAKNLQLKFYRTDKRDVQSVTDEGCECIGIVKINLSGPLDGTEHAVRLSFKFGEAEITVCGFDKMTGQLINTEVDFLGKSHSAS